MQAQTLPPYTCSLVSIWVHRASPPPPPRPKRGKLCRATLCQARSATRHTHSPLMLTVHLSHPSDSSPRAQHMTNARKLRNPGNLRTQVRTCEVNAINDTVGQVRASQDHIAGVRLMHAVWPRERKGCEPLGLRCREMNLMARPGRVRHKKLGGCQTSVKARWQWLARGTHEAEKGAAKLGSCASGGCLLMSGVTI